MSIGIHDRPDYSSFMGDDGLILRKIQAVKSVTAHGNRIAMIPSFIKDHSDHSLLETRPESINQRSY